MRGGPATVRVAHLRGNDQFGFAVVGESHYQFELEEIVGGRTEESAEFECVALLAPEPSNAFDPNATMVVIDGQKVGYLPRKAAERYTADRLAAQVDLAECRALIVGGWYRDEDDMGHFGVRLAVSLPFRFENICERSATFTSAEPPTALASDAVKPRSAKWRALCVVAIGLAWAGASEGYRRLSTVAEPIAVAETATPAVVTVAPEVYRTIPASTQETTASLAPARSEFIPIPRSRPQSAPTRVVSADR